MSTDHSSTNTGHDASETTQRPADRRDDEAHQQGTTMPTSMLLNILQQVSAGFDEDTRQARSLTAEEAEALYEQARQHYAGRRYEEALPLFKQLLASDRTNGDYYFSVAACMHKLGQNTEAAMHYYIAYTLDSSLVLSLFHGADCLMKLSAWSYAHFALVDFLSKKESKTELASYRKRALEMLKKVERHVQVKSLPPQLVQMLKAHPFPREVVPALNRLFQ